MNSYIGITLLIIGFCLVFLICVILIRTLRFTSKQVYPDPANGFGFDGKSASERLGSALRFKTISYQDSSLYDTQEFTGFHLYLERVFPNIHSKLKKETISDHSLLYTWAGKEKGLKPILLMAHIDVVPVEPETEDDWVYPPFGGRVAEGYIWGRGAMDDKVGVMAILEAVESLLGEGFQPERTIYLAFGHDEEVGGKRGAAKISEVLRSRGVRLEYVLDEGHTITKRILPGFPRPVALIGIAEKGYVSVELTVEGEGGHSSMPPKHTTVGTLGGVVHKLEEQQFPSEIRSVTRQMFEYLGPEVSFTRRMVFANLWLFGWLVERTLSNFPAGNALVRTTTAPTIFEGSVKENVLPADARAVVNFRILPGDTIEKVINHVRKTTDDPRIKIRPLEPGFEPSPVSDVNSRGFKAIEKTIREVFPETVVAPSLTIGTTDSRHYTKLSDNVYRFLPLQLNPEDLSRIHGTNERIAVQDYEQAIKFYIQLIRNSAGR